MALRSGASIVIACVACGTPAPPAPPHPAPTVALKPPPDLPRTIAAPPAPGLRLDSAAKPTHYALDLRIDPTKETFAGTVTIALAVGEPIGGLWLNGADLTIQHATVRAAGKIIEAKPIPATPATTEAQVIGFSFDRTLEAGTGEIEISYSGKIYNAELSGIHRMEDRGTWYAYTHFEAIDARRAFPCFDEPSFKVPFAITIRTPGDLAVANTFPASVRADGADKVFEFVETKPLPTYLVAFAVGPFEIVDAGKAGKNQTPIRIITTKGRAADAAYAAKTTPEIVTRLEDYFGIPYPYDKLDQIAEPRRGGAMENAGLITVGQQALLIPAAEETVSRKRRFASLAAHEIAHHWFGDLVTLAWWDDIWLNEAFASWMANKFMQEWQPSWGYDVGAVENRSNAMSGDSLPSTRRVREPITSRHDIGAAFDNMTYGKGSAVIAMFEHWIGRDKFREAVHDYLTKHAHGVANNADFMAALSAKAGQDVAPIADHFLGWAGIPLITATPSCDGKNLKIDFTQTRYAPLGSKLDQRPRWTVPMCIKWGTTAVDGHACQLSSDSARMTAANVGFKCPTWVHMNDSQLGYYRTAYSKPEIEKLLAVAPKLFTRPERIGLYGDLAALIDADKLPVTVALDTATKLATENDRFLLQTASGFLGYLNNEVVPKKLRANRARLVNKLFGARARKLGWVSPKGEDDDSRLLRGTMLSWVAHTGEDPAIIKQAKQLADKWLGDRAAIDPDLVGLALGIAARFGDRAFFDRLYAAARIERERRDRGQMLAAMSAFRDPTIVREALALSLADGFPAYESVALVWGAFNEDTREIAYKFVKEHYAELIARLPRDYSFIGIAGQFCDAAHRADAKAFLEPRIGSITNGPRSLAQTLERVDLCIARKAAQEKPIASFLSKY